MKRERGFTLVELMIVCVIIGVLASIAIPNFISLRDRALEGSTRANMHEFQLTAEDYSVQNDSKYAVSANLVANILPSAGVAFRNPFSGNTGQDVAWEDRANLADLPTATKGLVSYADSLGLTYNIKGVGRDGLPLNLSLSAGQ